MTELQQRIARIVLRESDDERTTQDLDFFTTAPRAAELADAIAAALLREGLRVDRLHEPNLREAPSVR